MSFARKFSQKVSSLGETIVHAEAALEDGFSHGLSDMVHKTGELTHMVHEHLDHEHAEAISNNKSANQAAGLLGANQDKEKRRQERLEQRFDGPDPNFVTMFDLVMKSYKLGTHKIVPKSVPTYLFKDVVEQYGITVQVFWHKRWYRATIEQIFPGEIVMQWVDWKEIDWPLERYPTDEQHLRWIRWPKKDVGIDINLLPPQYPVREKHTREELIDGIHKAAENSAYEEEWKSLKRKYMAVALLHSSATKVFNSGIDSLNANMSDVAGNMRTNIYEITKSYLEVKAVVVGDSGVGKSCLVRGLVMEDPQEGVRPTFAPEEASVQSDMDEEYIVKLRIWDTSGNKSYKSLSTMIYRGADVGIMVFDMTKRNTWKSIIKAGGWRQEFLVQTGATRADHFPLILVGNKNEDPSRVRVTEDEVRQWCRRHGNLPFVQTSSSNFEDVNRLFSLSIANSLERARGLPEYRAPDTIRLDYQRTFFMDPHILKEMAKAYEKEHGEMENEQGEFGLLKLAQNPLSAMGKLFA